jgi:hypothetical protein
MRARTSALAALVVVAVSCLGMVPAYAATPDVPVVSNVDASTPGHVTGTVSSDAPYVYVYLGSAWGSQELVPVDGAATFDLETWGFGGQQTLGVIACPTATPWSANCSSRATSGVQFEPTDVRPDVTWFTDDTVGPGQTASVTVADPQGGGTLHAVWEYAPGQFGSTPLDRNGTTELSLIDGAGPIQIERCSAVLELADTCTPFSPSWSKELQVHQQMSVSVGTIANITAANPTATVALDTDVTGSYQLTWHLTIDGQPVAGTGDTLSGALTDSGGVPAFVVDGATLNDGTYHLAGSLTVDNADFGTYQTDLPDAVVNIHRIAPTVDGASSSRATIYPLIDTPTYPRSVTFTFTGPEDYGYDHLILVRDSDGTTLTNLDAWTDTNHISGTWDGRGADGTAAPAGGYTAVVVDSWGNSAAVTAHVTVSPQRLVLRTFRTTVSASRSLVDKYVGRCSQLRKPSLRRWSGSLGFYANSRCKRQTWNASAVATVHAVRVPAAAEYRDVRVSLYGGAAKAMPRSRGVVRYLTAKGTWVAESVVSRSLGTHNGALQGMRGMLQDGRWFAWGFATAFNLRYDVRNFTVTVRYYVLG